MKFLLLALVIVGLIVASYAAWPAPAYLGSTHDRWAFGMINGSRVERNRNALVARWNQDLGRCAHAHAVYLARWNNDYNTTGHVWHSRGCGSRTTYETVGPGPSPSVIHAAFLSSNRHRPVVMGGLRYAGTGVSRDERGTYYVVYQLWK